MDLASLRPLSRQLLQELQISRRCHASSRIKAVASKGNKQRFITTRFSRIRISFQLKQASVVLSSLSVRPYRRCLAANAVYAQKQRAKRAWLYCNGYLQLLVDNLILLLPLLNAQDILIVLRELAALQVATKRASRAPRLWKAAQRTPVEASSVQRWIKNAALSLTGGLERQNNIAVFFKGLQLVQDVFQSVEVHALKKQFTTVTIARLYELSFEEICHFLLGLTRFPTYQLPPPLLNHVLTTLKKRVQQAEMPVVLARIPRSPSNPKNKRINTRRVSLPLMKRGMIGLDCRSFLILPYCLATLSTINGPHHSWLLAETIARVRPLYKSRLPAPVFHVLLCAEGLSIWAQRYQDTERPGGGTRRVEETRVALEIAQRCVSCLEDCLQYALFMTRNISYAELIALGNALHANQIQSVKVWNLWADLVETGEYAEASGKRVLFLSKLTIPQIGTCVQLWRQLQRPVQRLQYRAAQLLSIRRLNEEKLRTDSLA